MKTLTREQLQGRKEKAVRFTRDIRDDPDRAAEIEDESLDEYAERRHITLSNPKGVRIMAAESRRDLLRQIKELKSENEDLQDRLDGIADLVAPDEDEDDTEGED